MSQPAALTAAPVKTGSDGLARSFLLNRSSLSAEGRRSCTARAGLRFYTSRLNEHRAKMGMPPLRKANVPKSCPRYLAKLMRSKARAARREYARWRAYHYDWASWLPDKFARVGACETGYGRRPGRWDWDSGTYVSAFGIYRPAYAQFARATGTPTWDEPGRRTPREQFIVASAIQARFGWSAWGCASA